MSPRLHNIRERHYENIYDAHRLDRHESWVRLFGNANVGNIILTNLQVGGQLASEQSFVICNIYVRTNVRRTPMSEIEREVARDAFLEGRDDDGLLMMLKAGDWERSPLTRAFDNWAHTCVLRLVVGSRPMFTMNVHDLMGGPAFSAGAKPEKPGVKTDDSELLESPAWRKHLAKPIFVPVRQNFDVELIQSATETEALRRCVDGASAPPLLWVHLEGISSRSIQ